MKVDVRCCCDPGRLLGRIDVPGIGKVEQGMLKVRLNMAEGQLPGSGFIGLELAECYLGGEHVVAVKSNDLPIEVFRRIKGFEEASVHEQLRDCQARAQKVDDLVQRKVKRMMDGDTASLDEFFRPKDLKEYL